MSQSRLSKEAFEYYVGLGADRSYQAVARHYGTSKRSVATLAKKERWQERLEALVAAVRSGRVDETTKAEFDVDAKHANRMASMQDALFDMVTPSRMKTIIGSLIVAAVQKGDVGAGRFLVERMLGKVRSEPLPATAIDLPDGLETTGDVRRASNALLQAVADGSISPEDAQKAAVVVEAARKSIETDVLEKRITAIEENIKKDGNQ
jgi:hypothetical protein